MAQMECDLRTALDTVAECRRVYHPACDSLQGQCSSELQYPALNASVRFVGVGCPWFCKTLNGSNVEARAALLPKIIGGATLIIFSISSHYEGLPAEQFNRSLQQFGARLRRTHLPVAVLSPSVTHFPTQDGEYHGGTTRSSNNATAAIARGIAPAGSTETGHCRARPQPLTEHMHTAGLRQLASSLPLGQFVDIYALSDDPRGHPRWHTGADGKMSVANDCRHFCQNCLMLRAWNSRLLPLMQATPKGERPIQKALSPLELELARG